MNDRRLLRVLRVVPWGTGGVTALCMARLLWPLPVWTPPGVELEQPVVPKAETPRLSLDDLAVIWKRNLRGPLFDPPPEPVKPTEPARLVLSLVGTVVEPDRSYAVFRLADSSTVVKPVGAQVDGFDVVDVRRGIATLRNGSREYELKVPWFDRIERE